jgi:hypothetical protein
MGKPCQYVFRYNGDQNTQDVVPDLDGTMPMPVRGEIIQRKGKPWKVVHVSTEQVISPNPPIPVHTVSLTSDLTLAI